MNNQFIRTISLIGEDNFNIIQNKTILICGLGGVGGTTFASLLRTGFKHFIIVDFDKVDISNINRQILFNLNSVDKLKTDEAYNYALSINKDVDIKKINMKIDEQSIAELEQYDVDYIVDAIDYVPGKIALAKLAQKKNVPFIMSLGMANRIDSSNIIITKLNKTTDDPLARKLRYEFKNSGIDTSLIDVAFSKANPIKKQITPFSCMMVPSTAGLIISSKILKDFIKIGD